MLNLEKEINEYLEDVEETETWEIKSDEEAEWWIEKKAEELAEVRRYKISIENKINLLKEKLDKAKNEEENILVNRDFYLQKYFETIDEKQLKKTKTQQKYRLPTLELVKKYPSPTFKRDDEKLSEWLENNKMNELVEIKKKAKWGELKKLTQIVGDQVVYIDTGEVVEGVEVEERPAEFKVVE